MKEITKPQDLFINTLVGSGATFRGDLQVEGILRIDGDFWGQIKSSSRVFIGAGGRMKSQITAKEVVVGGALKGDVVATDRVIILSTGMVIGNIYTPKLVLEEGMILEGYCSVTPRISETSVSQNLQKSTMRKQIYAEGNYNPFQKESSTVASWNE